MSFGPSNVLRNGKMQATMSTWTPLNHQLSNDHIFEERRALLGKWFDKWTDSQRKLVLQDFFSRCSAAQLKFLRRNLCSRVPGDALDFTAMLPRVLSLYIFSFLDPRSLCRCAQVSWHWKSLAELDQLWMPKCLRLGWCISFAPSPFEQGVWKRHYIETVQELHVTKPKAPCHQEFVVPEVKVIGCQKEESLATHTGWVRSAGSARRGGKGASAEKGLPPWRDSDRHPTDTLRFNYLENLDPIEQANLTRAKAKKIDTATRHENGRMKPLCDPSYKLRKARSLFLSLDPNSRQQRQSRPKWATSASSEYPVTKDTADKLSQVPQWNAGIRPTPVRDPVPRMSERGLKASLRSHRSSPTVRLFEGQP
ncbi:F-box only protein 16 isoform X2 [Brienomyrus brachyistius]|uniref:F-box only protein 16 isoform X2 n=1 Tax=Brienomyrus brachyistius TaxID=42636 RepID=UPI0020B2DBEE|nr:F-box only protein 16 isoform X2 [Brienomyrus brachyistius]